MVPGRASGMVRSMNALATAALCVASVSIYVGINHLIYFLHTRERREILAFAFTCFAAAAYQAASGGLYMAGTTLEGAACQVWQAASLALFVPCMLWFASTLVHRTLRWWDYLVIDYFLAQIVALLVDHTGLTWTHTPMTKSMLLFGRYSSSITRLPPVSSCRPRP